MARKIKESDKAEIGRLVDFKQNLHRMPHEWGHHCSAEKCNCGAEDYNILVQNYHRLCEAVSSLIEAVEKG